MRLKNSIYNYGSIAKWLHWTTALLFLLAYCSVYYRQWFTEKGTPENWTALQLHLSVGISIAVIISLRIIWRLTNPQPHLESASPLANFAAHTGHFALYAIMIIAPLTGYLGTGVNTEFLFLFEIPKFEHTALFQSWVAQGMGLSFEQFEKPIDFIHKQVLGKWLIWMLILGHAAAALYHHYVKKDRTLIKMTTGKDQLK
ncbi:cytochrome B [Acinetobacter proteolyticus]|uniref:cytochrome b n=1 Tax=Acinetobacter proteolyticus TaxID=1776741 RepID=UPI0008631959|nr:cytochrome b [Acinetobacter proteolyticus]OEY92678.1 cytochrome B [Acinetobacter proteolyticus]QHH93248.1 cytochrome b [Acinetobacter gyllenbergii]